MRDIELNRMRREHKHAQDHVNGALCPICHYPLQSTTETQYIDYTDMHGGVCWGGNEEVPIWKCINGHKIHIVVIAGGK